MSNTPDHIKDDTETNETPQNGLEITQESAQLLIEEMNKIYELILQDKVISKADLQTVKKLLSPEGEIGKEFERIKDFLDLLKSKGIEYSFQNSMVVCHGNVDLSGSDIKNLPTGLKVEGSLDISDTKITQLPKKLVVGWALQAENTSITKLPNSLKANELFMSHSQISEIPEDMHIKETIDLSHNPLTTLPDKFVCFGVLDLSHTKIESLENCILSVGNNLFFTNTPLHTLPRGLAVGWNLFLNGTKITKLRPGIKIRQAIFINEGQKLDPNGSKVKIIEKNI